MTGPLGVFAAVLPDETVDPSERFAIENPGERARWSTPESRRSQVTGTHGGASGGGGRRGRRSDRWEDS